MASATSLGYQMKAKDHSFHMKPCLLLFHGNVIRHIRHPLPRLFNCQNLPPFLGLIFAWSCLSSSQAENGAEYFALIFAFFHPYLLFAVKSQIYGFSFETTWVSHNWDKAYLKLKFYFHCTVKVTFSQIISILNIIVIQTTRTKPYKLNFWFEFAALSMGAVW